MLVIITTPFAILTG